jgi:hypothetical protein
VLSVSCPEKKRTDDVCKRRSEVGESSGKGCGEGVASTVICHEIIWEWLRTLGWGGADGSFWSRRLSIHRRRSSAAACAPSLLLWNWNSPLPVGSSTSLLELANRRQDDPLCLEGWKEALVALIDQSWHPTAHSSPSLPPGP